LRKLQEKAEEISGPILRDFFLVLYGHNFSVSKQSQGVPKICVKYAKYNILRSIYRLLTEIIFSFISILLEHAEITFETSQMTIPLSKPICLGKKIRF